MYTDTDMDSTQEGFYTLNNKFQGKDTVTVYVQKTF